MRHVTAGEHDGRFTVHFPATNTTIREESLTGRFIRERFTCSVRARSLRKMRVKAASFFSSPRRAPKTRSSIPPTSRTGGGGVSLEDGGEEGGEGNRGLETFEKALERGTFAGLRETKRRQQLATAAEFGLERGRLTQRGDHGHALV